MQQGQRRAVFLESVAPHFNWGKEKLVQRLLRQAHATDRPAHWITYRTATWMLAKEGTVPHRFGFAGPVDGPCDEKALRADLELLGRYVDVNLLPSGLPLYAQTPVPGWKWERGSAARAIHGLLGLVLAGGVLGRGSWRQHGEEGIRRCLNAVEISNGETAGTLKIEGLRCGPMADCLLLIAANRVRCEENSRHHVNAIAARVAAMLHEDGSVFPSWLPVRMDRDNDFLPNAAILALAMHYRKAPGALANRFDKSRHWQLRRFQRLHRWGQAGWLPQACAELYYATGDAVYANTAFEVADWCLDQQIEATGAFLEDFAPGGPTFNTAFIAEAIADAWGLALACNDPDRARRYEKSWHAALCFARRLIIRPVDAPCLPDAHRSIGGVRCSVTGSLVRIDFVSHLIIAIVKGLRVAASAGSHGETL